MLGRLGNPSSRAGATPPSERRKGGARGLDSVAPLRLARDSDYRRAVRAQRRARANCCCVPTTVEGDSDGRHLDAVPIRPAYHK